MGTFVTQEDTPTLFESGTKQAAPNGRLPDGWTNRNVAQAADLNALHDALLDVRTDLRAHVRNVKHCGAVGDGVADDTAAIQAAIDAGNGYEIVFPPGNYKITSTIRLKAGRSMRGSSSRDGSGGTIITWAADDGTPAFDSDPEDYLAWFSMRDIQVITGLTPGSTGSGDCFRVYGVTNNSAFIRIEVRNFRGNAWHLSRLTSGTDNTAASNAHFEQCFAISCGGYAFKIDGFSMAVFTMCDVNSCVGGAFHLLNGSGNQSMVVVHGLWWEGNQAWSSNQPVLLEDMAGQSVIFQGCTFSGPSTGTDVVRTTGTTTANVSLAACAGWTYSNWFNDTVGGKTIAWSNRVFYSALPVIADQVTAQGTSPVFEIIDSDGTANQRRFRWAMSGNILTLDSRTDAAAVSKSILQVAHNTGVASFPSGIKVPVYATASLPVASAANDGLVVIEDAAAGDRNLIIYAGGQRFRIDGGAAF